MALIGQGAYGAPVDYSAWDNSSGLLAQAMAMGAQQIGGQVVDIVKDRKDKKDKLKAGGELLDAAMKLYPELQGPMSGVAEALKNEEMPLGARAQLGDQIGSLINLGVQQSKDALAAGMDKQQFELDKRAFDMKEQEFNRQQFEAGKAMEEQQGLQELAAPSLLQQALAMTEQYEQGGGQAAINSDTLRKAMEATPGQQLSLAQAALSMLPGEDKVELRDIKFQRDGQDFEGTAAFNRRTGKLELVPVVEGGQAWGDGSGGNFLPEQNAIAAELDANGVISEATEQRVKESARGYLSNAGVDMDKVPLGMRNNNPTNIVFPGMDYARRVGALGASRNKDAGSSKPGGGSYNQLVFGDPVTGMRAGAQLAARKYSSGATTAAQLIAGNNGWTPGNTEAAANVARSMGLGPNDDLRLNEPARMKSFLKALVKQEHGNAGGLYKEDVYNRALGLGGGVTAGAAKGGAETPLDIQLKEATLAEKQQNVAGKAQEQKAAASKEADLKRAALSSAQEALREIDEIPKHPGFSAAVGAGLRKSLSDVWGVPDEPVAGSDEAGSVAQIEKLRAHAFLTGIQQLRGMGALSDAEGKKIDAAVANLERSQSEDDFKKALGNFRRVIEETVTSMGGTPSAPGQQAPPTESAAARRLRELREKKQ